MAFYHSSLLQTWSDMLLDGERFPAYARDLERRLHHDVSTLAMDMGFIFDSVADSVADTRHCVDLLRRWHVLENNGGFSPSLAAMCLVGLQGFGLAQDVALCAPVLTAAVLGDRPNTLPYHGTIHYKKVLLQVMRLIAAHNTIYAGTPKNLSGQDIAVLMIAACVHDIGHDGRGNTVQGVFTQGRLERQSFEQAAPYLRMAGLSDDDLRRLFVMILCTEVSPMGDPANPAAQMKAAYRYHFSDGERRTHALNLDASYKALETDAKLVMMALLLHEGDVATSSGLTYEMTKFETALYREEFGQHDAAPSHVLEFLRSICQRQFLSDAAQALYAGNMARIYALAVGDYERGNDVYPAAQHSDFMLDMREDADAPRTIN